MDGGAGWAEPLSGAGRLPCGVYTAGGGVRRPTVDSRASACQDATSGRASTTTWSSVGSTAQRPSSSHPTGECSWPRSGVSSRSSTDFADRTPTVFADLRTQVYNFWDRGCSGLALHPDFPVNPSVYVIYSHDAAPAAARSRWGRPAPTQTLAPLRQAHGRWMPGTGRLSRLTATATRRRAPSRCSSTTGASSTRSHSIGTLEFGADGALYVSGGEGASFDCADYGQAGDPLNPCGDPPGGLGATLTPPRPKAGRFARRTCAPPADPTRARRHRLRIDPDTGRGLPDNPLASSPDPNARRIVAYGLRNPFRFTVRPGTDELWIGDVGRRTWEEINRSIGNDGQVDNFGWPCYGGRGPHAGLRPHSTSISASRSTPPAARSPPCFTYRHAQWSRTSAARP